MDKIQSFSLLFYFGQKLLHIFFYLNWGFFPESIIFFKLKTLTKR